MVVLKGELRRRSTAVGRGRASGSQCVEILFALAFVPAIGAAKAAVGTIAVAKRRCANYIRQRQVTDEAGPVRRLRRNQRLFRAWIQARFRRKRRESSRRAVWNARKVALQERARDDAGR